MYKLVQPSRLYQQIVQQIEQSVLNGGLKPGDQLPAERELATQFGVSRTAVREAIKALREKGLVELQPGRGTFVTNSTSNSMRHSLDFMTRIGQQDSVAYLTEVRAALEPEIAALAATRVSEQHLSALREALRVMDRSYDNPEAYIEADLDFHLTLAEAVANPIFLSLIDSIVDLLREQRMRIFQVEGGPERGQHHHKLILKAIERRDPQTARTAMSEHLEQVSIDSSIEMSLKAGVTQ